MNTLELWTNVAHDVARRAKGRLVLIGAALLVGVLLVGVLLSAGTTLADTPTASAFLPDASCGTRCVPVAPSVGFLPQPQASAWRPV